VGRHQRRRTPRPAPPRRGRAPRKPYLITLVYPSTAKSQADVRAIVALGLLSLALPGSNYLFFDGLPVSKPLEFLCASLIIFALLARSTRDVLAEQLFRHSRLHQWLKLLMVVVVTVKVTSISL
jgi:hypothetical protein